MIGVGEVGRTIIAKAVMSITRRNIQNAVGTMQLCARQVYGVEATIHAVRKMFDREKTEAVLLVDASNEFNSLNTQAALQNICRLCPSFATILTNTYREPMELFLDGDVLLLDDNVCTCNSSSN